MSNFGGFGSYHKKDPTKEKADQMSQPWRRGSTSTVVTNQENQSPAGDVPNSTRGNIPTARTPLGEIPSQAVNNSSRPRFDVGVIRGAQRPPTAASSPPRITQDRTPEVDDEGFKKVEKKSKHRREQQAVSTVLSSVLENNLRQAGNTIPLTATQTSTRRGSGGVPFANRKTKLYGVLWSEQISGIIVRRKHFCRSKDPNQKLGDEGVFEGPDGRPWIVKWRFFIIIRKFDETVADIPIYTFDDRGLAAKPDHALKEYLSVKPVRVAAKDFVNQNPENPVLNVEKNDGRYALSRLTMVARYTEICTRSLDCDELLVVGNLDKESTKTLLEYAYKKMYEDAMAAVGGAA